MRTIAKPPLDAHDPSIADYTSDPDIARGYDRYHDYLSGLFDYDFQFVSESVRPNSRVLDLGCGTGRHVTQLAALGHEMTGVDLSPHMLRETSKKLDRLGLKATLLCSDICDLSALPAASFDCVICMFSTLGLVRGKALRRKALAEWRRVLVDGGIVVLHVHNAWHNLRDAWGRGWLIKSLFGSVVRAREFGDSWMPNYCGLECLYLHLFTWGELRSLLKRSGFEISRAVFLNDRRTGPYEGALSSFRSNGFLVRARAR
jgi:ubiquinone/menaquinone biosynthesis C-methylase UbiE